VSLNGGGDRSRARVGGRLTRTFNDADDELQRSAGDEIRLCGGGTMGSPTERQRARATARVSIFTNQNSS
jgi:hypothetical protein